MAPLVSVLTGFNCIMNPLLCLSFPSSQIPPPPPPPTLSNKPPFSGEESYKASLPLLNPSQIPIYSFMIECID